ncbi:hypothetical protein HYH02_009084 [Chlamydomonas schloesseri]|uniref:Uncharacterized protein n=1 Tax=Chlamydomonas schloesseri TaxID=2026947 RepID=A0A835WB44_9CHLO|nr:hypothetical protein HYH02_009084 [Chlamydomonas schloesseri]|eukprot:KAG2444145.1 hypothetical protein HYH02_009084 [Chlamydomonas schloesseri]
MFGSRSSPTQQLAADVQAVQGVVQRAELLLRAGDADGARALLSQQGREVGKLSYGLGFGTEAYRLLPAQAGREVLSKLEAARAALAVAAAVALPGAAEEQQFLGGLPTGGREDAVTVNGAGVAAKSDGSVARDQEAVGVALARLREVGALLQTLADFLEAAGD